MNVAFWVERTGNDYGEIKTSGLDDNTWYVSISGRSE